MQSASHLEGGTECSDRKVSALVPAIYQGEGTMSLELPVNNALHVGLHAENTIKHILHSIKAESSKGGKKSTLERA